MAGKELEPTAELEAVLMPTTHPELMPVPTTEPDYETTPVLEPKVSGHTSQVCVPTSSC